MEPTTDHANSNPTATPIVPNQSPATEQTDNSLLMGILAYLGILVIIPYLMAKDNPFVKYHVKQGIVLTGLWLIVYVLGVTIIPYSLYQIFSLINLGVLALAIFGIVHVVQKKEAPLPLIGQFADKVKI